MSKPKRFDRVNFCFTMEIVMAVIALSLLITSFFMPPRGVIDPSVLTAGGIIFAFASLFFAREAFMKGKSTKFSHGQTSVEIGHNEPAAEHIIEQQ